MVRFLDNFSLGERGSASAECFIAHGFRVVYLYREGSIVPFTRGFRKELAQQIDHKLLSHLELTSGYFPEICISKETKSRSAYSRLVSELQCYQACKDSQQLLMIPFTSVTEYISLLEIVATELGKAYRSQCLFYLAAAVSDFYLPPEDMVEHKIQSHGGDGGLILSLKSVPKTLGKMTGEWAPHSFVTSFKLETDQQLVITKAQKAIQQYRVHLVVANQLQTRRDIVYLVSPKRIDSTEEVVVEEVTRPAEAGSIDPYLVSRVVRLYSHFYAESRLVAGSVVCEVQYTQLTKMVREHIETYNLPSQMSECGVSDDISMDIVDIRESLAACISPSVFFTGGLLLGIVLAIAIRRR